MIGQAIWAKNVDQNAKKLKRGPLSHWKIKCVFVGLCSIFWWSAKQSEQKTLTKMQKNDKRPPKSLKNKMFVLGLHSISDDRAKRSKQETVNRNA